MASPSEIVSAAAAAASAIGGAFAAWAAFRSADSARVAQRAAEDAERRAAIRQAVVTVSEVLVEAQRVEARATEVKLAYQSLAVFSGSVGNSRIDLYLSAVSEKTKRAGELSSHAQLFSGNTGSLERVPLEEIDRVHMSLSTALTEVRALREDLEREHAFVDGQCAVYRDKVVRSSSKQ